MTAPDSRSADRLLQLSDEVSRIAGTLARLSTEAAPRLQAATILPEITASQVTSVIRARRLRERFFPANLFADPAWDILLALFQAELSQHRVSVSTLSAAVSVPATTCLRWITTLVEQGLLVRQDDPFDGRRVFLELSGDASTALKRYFAEVNAS